MKCIAETNRDLFTGGFSRASISLLVSTLSSHWLASCDIFLYSNWSRSDGLPVTFSLPRSVVGISSVLALVHPIGTRSEVHVDGFGGSM